MTHPTHSAAPAASVLTRRQHHVLVALGGLAVALVATNGTLFLSNRGLQDDITARAAMVQQTVPLEALQRDIARSLADLAIKGRDRQLLDMLAANGVTVTMNAPTNTTPNAAPNAAAPTSDSIRP